MQPNITLALVGLFLISTSVTAGVTRKREITSVDATATTENVDSSATTTLRTISNDVERIPATTDASSGKVSWASTVSNFIDFTEKLFGGDARSTTAPGVETTSLLNKVDETTVSGVSKAEENTTLLSGNEVSSTTLSEEETTVTRRSSGRSMFQSSSPVAKSEEETTLSAMNKSSSEQKPSKVEDETTVSRTEKLTGTESTLSALKEDSTTLVAIEENTTKVLESTKGQTEAKATSVTDETEDNSTLPSRMQLTKDKEETTTLSGVETSTAPKEIDDVTNKEEKNTTSLNIEAKTLSGKESLPSTTPLEMKAVEETTSVSETTTEQDVMNTSTSRLPSEESTTVDVSANEIKSSNGTLPEKRGKFMQANSSNTNDLTLPGNAEVWALAGMKSPIDEGKEHKKPENNSVVAKTLTDWTHIMKEVEVFNTTLTSKENMEATTEAALPSVAISERPESNQIVDDLEVVLDKPRNVSSVATTTTSTTTKTTEATTVTITSTQAISNDLDGELVTKTGEGPNEVGVAGTMSPTSGLNESTVNSVEETSADSTTEAVIAPKPTEKLSTPESSIETNAIDKLEEPTATSTQPSIVPATPVVHFLPSSIPTINDNAVDEITPPTAPGKQDEDELLLHTSPTPSVVGFPVPKFIGYTTEISREMGEPLSPDDIDPEPQETDYNVIIAISVSVVGIVALILLVGFLYVMRKRQKQMSYGQRCRPVSLDAYSLDNVSVYNSVRRKGALRASKRSYGNAAFDDPSLKHNVLGTHELAKFVERKSSIYEEFKDVPQIIARADEVPQGCDDKNRYANVVPLPETRVILQQQNGDERTEYINANYVRGPKDAPNYYIACQGPLESTIADFWRMIWEQNSRVIIMATDLTENGIEKCAEYLPPSVTLDNHTVHGDYQVTLKNREVKEKYAVSTVILKNVLTDSSREIAHFWYQWPVVGVPNDEAAIIAMLLEARSALKMYAVDMNDARIEVEADGDSKSVHSNGNSMDKSKASTKSQGPLTIHCSNGTGRTGTVIACDMAIRSLETPKRTVDIPQLVYYVRRGRASAIQTKEQYEFIYRVTQMYATKLCGPINDN